MCGIAGFIDYNKTPDEKVLRAMEQSLAHRGPDEGHIWVQRHCGLVHRRLRVIDLSPGAAQPMSNEDGRLWVVFNGEIYNFQQLRQTLLELGHQFRSRSDTEVLLHGYEAWGEGLFRQLRGMFALALWDQALEKLILARDRLGKKPLFFTSAARRFVFGSELAIFKHLPDFEPVLDRQAYREYLEYGYVPSPNTILAGVQRLPAGHYAVWSQSGYAAKPYWSLPIEPDLPRRREGHPNEAAADLEILLREAVACRLISDVPLGCFLSGGIDSSLVAALAQESMGAKLKTYTVGFEFSPSSEACHAAKVARHIGSDHHEIQVNANSVLAEFEEIMSKTSEPIADDSFVPTFLISRATRQHVTVALSGDGGDELFAGYVKYRQFHKARIVQRCLPLPWVWLARLPWNDRIKKSLEALATENSLELARWLSSLWKRKQIPGILAPGSPSESPADFFLDRWKVRTRYSEVERWMLTDMETYLEGDILPKVDRAS
ncbi:MAG: asparagine synthase (glutamine-hydrolyzing), partial [Chloroflexi bacterium]|nr:asparagine synthase (glutamine-hydrolyzing) [Chloroflexota bacterium]